MLNTIILNEQIVRVLEGILPPSYLDQGISPGNSGLYSSYESSVDDTNKYNEDLKRFKKLPSQSRDYHSLELQRSPSEYDISTSGSSSKRNTREIEIGRTKRSR